MRAPQTRPLSTSLLLEGITMKTSGFMRLSIFSACGLLAAPQMCVPQEREGIRPPSIRVSGEATVTARPDQAILDVGVVTQADTAEAAAAQNARRADAVLADLRKVLGSGADIKTVSYSVSPNYRYPREGGQPTITGYTATNILRAQINDLDVVGKVIDGATQSGANRIERMQFRLRNETEVQNEALRQSARMARSKADAMASALGLKVLRVLSAEESTGPIVRPMDERMFATARAEAAPATPIEPGNIEFRAVTILTVEVGSK
jgi:uncharacterized protein YggE